ncbi:MAG: hypothetical protein HYV60_18880 [Planctomycetia bacterium]|nr:hypothetical protein [Planctomycetia bacterium]
MSGNPYENPYQPASGGYGPGGGKPPTGQAAQMVSGPAIGLIVTAGIGLAIQALALVANVAGVGMGAAAGPDGAEGAQMIMSGGIGIASGIVAIGIGIVILMGALKMKKLESHGFAMAAAILAAIPCLSPCCLIGLPVGIWAVVVLNKPEVKSAFH